LSIGVLGAGRMGQSIAKAIDSRDDLRLTCLWVRDEGLARDLSIPAGCISSDLDRVVSSADVLIDFSLPAASAQILEAVVRLKKPLVCGVSGLDEAQLASLGNAATRVPLVYDRNMSVGVTVLEDLVRRAAGSLGPSFEVEIHETHHIHKKDAPSGTALKLGEAIAEVRVQDFREVAWYAPDAGSRTLADGDIRFEVERRGEVPGDHSVTLRSPAEQMILSHSVTTRQVFADGALRAARWLVEQEPGRYSMKDVLFS
jgi:4-hydroxy-tetrahydrodipicolinate reductase